MPDMFGNSSAKIVRHVAVMQTEQFSAAKNYRWRRHLARMFGVKLTGDIPERLIAAGVPIPLSVKRRRRLASIRSSGVLFIHVPKNAGTSLSMALYGHAVTHDTMRYYAHVAPDFVASATSVAVVRDPVARFVSAFRYAATGGTRHRRVSEPFRAAYQAFRSIDAALDHLERHRDPFAVDHIFRAQCWYLTDAAGRLAVDHLVPIDDLGRLHALFADRKVAPFPRLNASRASATMLSDVQRARIRRLYAEDVALWESVRGDRPRADRTDEAFVGAFVASS
ncbi:sulfotransferase [Sphingomonas arantia]|uniref:Sulfotransferase n=1 Tax=Sphingomonas arantia TaxID=1460676 RepID=A0ABW4TUG3_9SPHN